MGIDFMGIASTETLKNKFEYMVTSVICLVQIGPPNSRFLASKDKSSWDPKDVADCILSDRSTMVHISFSLDFFLTSFSHFDLKKRKILPERNLLSLVMPFLALHGAK